MEFVGNVMFCCVFEWVLGRLEFNVSWFLLLLRLCFLSYVEM